MSLLERDSVLVSTTENGDPIVDLPFTRVNNVEGIGRSPNTTYSVGNVVYVDSNLSVALKCTTAGTTSADELDISGVSVGESIADGSVVWAVITRSEYLPLAGGELTGNIHFDNGTDTQIYKDVTNGRMIIRGGNFAFADGASLYLHGKDYSDVNLKGAFRLYAHDGTTAKALEGKPDGTLTWNGKSLLTEAPNNPVGTILSMGGTSVPSGYLACDGSAVSRTTYAALFAKIGTTYGSGDGSTTFNLPNMSTELVSNISTGNLAVKGNGKTLGLTNGSANGGFETYVYQGVTHLKVLTKNYNINVKSTNGTTSTDPIYGGFGVTTDGSKSGMIVPVTATKTTVKYCIKY